MAAKTKKLSREDIAKIEIGKTAITNSCARFLLVFFLAVIFVVPVIQHAQEMVAHYHGKRPRIVPQCYDILRSVRLAVERGRDVEGSLYHKVITGNRFMLHEMNMYEEALEEESWLTELLLPPTQWVLTAILGVGNEMAYCGKGQWLYYRPDVDYLTSPGFLDRNQLLRRKYDHEEWEPNIQSNPLLAICQFADQLAERGARLIIVPVPVKPVVLPHEFAALDGSVQNPSYAEFLESLKEAGISVFDPTEIILGQSGTAGGDDYLKTDTHWTPAVVDRVAAALAEEVRRGVNLSPAVGGFTRGAEQVRQLGDIAVMLQLPESQCLYKPESVEINPVFGAAGELWMPSRSAEVLVLGDSFANIFSLPTMGWGAAAGLVEQLAFYLQYPVDRIVRNDAGAYATRQLLSRELAKGRDRLAGKKVVIWEFAMRELSFGDWKMLPMELGEPSPTEFIVPGPGETLDIEGVIQETSPVPRPGTVPYKDHVMALHLVDVASEGQSGDNNQALVYLWSMRDNEWTGAATLRAGQWISLSVVPWMDVEADYDAVNRSEVENEDVALEEPCWGIIKDISTEK